MKSNEFLGLWHICEMSEWDKDYVNMEVQAYVKIGKAGNGEFQFGLVSGAMDGKIVNHPEGKRFEFMWEGNDECDDASGSGWFRQKGADEIEGEIRIHGGDSSGFKARRADKFREDAYGEIKKNLKMV